MAYKRRAKTTDKVDVYEIVTETIIASLEKGTVPWRKPWTQAGTLPMSMSTKNPYRGVNVLLLSLVGAQYASPWWGTYDKIQELGGQVRKDEPHKGRLLVDGDHRDADDGTKTPKIALPALRVQRRSADWPEGLTVTPGRTGRARAERGRRGHRGRVPERPYICTTSGGRSAQHRSTAGVRAGLAPSRSTRPCSTMLPTGHESRPGGTR